MNGVALRGPGIAISHAELGRVVDGAAAGLAAQGVEPGDVVALWSDNRVEGAVAVLALARLGAVAAPMNPTMTAVEADRLLERLAPRAVIVLGPSAPFPIRQITVALDGTGEPSSPPPSPDETALILFTAGSTGLPKQVPLTHRNLAASVASIRRTYRLSPGDATLLAMPLSHGHGLIAGLLATLAGGGTAVFPAAGRFSAHTFRDELVEAGATWYTASPTMHRIILAHGGDFPRLRFVRSCSEFLPIEDAERLAAAFRAPILPAYGMTETAHQAAANPLPSDGRVDLSTVGRPTGVTVSIRRSDGSPAESKEEGEIWVRGESVAAHYSDAEGWFHTGDLGSVDGAGYLTVSGRLKNIIDRGGEKIAPQEVEQVLLTDRNVAAAAVFGLPDPMYGERVAAAVVARPHTTIDVGGLLAEARRVLPGAAVPHDVHVVTELPLTGKGTVDHQALVRRFRAAS
ncbi:AMP-binding protein [Actinoplanes sp. CA-054009]